MTTTATALVLSTPMLEEMKAAARLRVPQELALIEPPDFDVNVLYDAGVDDEDSEKNPLGDTFDNVGYHTMRTVVDEIVHDEPTALRFLREMQATEHGVCTGHVGNDFVPPITDRDPLSITSVTQRIAMSHLEATLYTELVRGPLEQLYATQAPYSAHQTPASAASTV